MDHHCGRVCRIGPTLCWRTKNNKALFVVLCRAQRGGGSWAAAWARRAPAVACAQTHITLQRTSTFQSAHAAVCQCALKHMAALAGQWGQRDTQGRELLVLFTFARVMMDCLSLSNLSFPLQVPHSWLQRVFLTMPCSCTPVRRDIAPFHSIHVSQSSYIYRRFRKGEDESFW